MASTPQPAVLPRDRVAARLEQYSAVAPTLLIGPPGTGKTSMVYEMAERTGQRIFKVACHQDALVGDVLGMYAPIAGQWGWQDGPAAHAFRDGGILLVDDLHMAGGGITAALMTAFDGFHGGAITQPDGSALRAAPGFRAIATMNGTVDVLEEWLADRLRYTLAVFTPSTPMLDALDPYVRVLCEADYTATYEPLASYRAWRALSDARKAGIPLEEAALAALGSDEQVAQKVTQALAKLGDPDAAHAVTRLAALLPSGAAR